MIGYPKPVQVSCYCPITDWSQQPVPNPTLCGRCQKWQEWFNKQYSEAVDNLSDFQRALL